MTSTTTDLDDPTAGAHLDDDQLQAIYRHRGPFLTLYLDTPGLDPESRHEFDLRWKSLRRVAVEEGAPEELLAQVDAVIDGVDVFDDTLVVVATNTEILLDGPIGARRGMDQVFWHELPRLVPLIERRAEQIPYVVVLADREGADLAVVDRDDLATAATVEGSRLHLSRSAPGGWSQRRYQQRAENQWERNAAEVAAHVAELADEVGAAFVAVAGDVRALQFLGEHLADRHRDLLREIRGGRHEGDDLDGAAEDVARLQATAAAEVTVAALEDYAQQRAASKAVQGADATFASLQRGMVRRLFVVDDLGDDRPSSHCWITDEPMLVAADGASLRDLGHTPRRAPAVDAAIRAALAQGGDVVLAPRNGPKSPDGGIGAVLRG